MIQKERFTFWEYGIMFERSTRRGFLKRSAAMAAAGGLVPSIFVNTSARAAAANDRIGVGAIGMGFMGSTIAHGAAELGAMVACADVNLQQAERFAKDYQGCQPYQDYRRILDRNDVHVVTIGTPDHWHAKIAIDAMRAGKDVFCEKPLTLTIEEGQILCRVARETGAVVQVGTQQRSDRVRFLNAVAIVRSGRLGRPVTATCSVGGSPTGGPFATADPPDHLDWDFWLGQCPVVPFTPERCYRSFRHWLEYAGGQVTDWGAHHVDIAHWALGHEHTGPVEVEGVGKFPIMPDDFDPVAFFAGRQTIPNGFNVPTSFRAVASFANGDRIIIQPSGDNGVLFEGPEGRIFVGRGRLTGLPIEQLTASDYARLADETLDLHKGMPFTVDVSNIDVTAGMQPGGWWRIINRAHMTNFFECVRERKEPVSDVFSHHRAVSTCHLANIAMLLKRTLRWDPEKEDFVGDETASNLVARPRRNPYGIKT
jgi:myo-inositol 2-dehydrogenase / D-chiro-inositol 1-dehydrogenase